MKPKRPALVVKAAMQTAIVLRDCATDTERIERLASNYADVTAWLCEEDSRVTRLERELAALRARIQIGR